MTTNRHVLDGVPSRLSAVLLGLASACLIVFLSLHVLDREPDLGYLSDPEIGRTLAFVVLPGFAWLVAVLVWAVARSTRPGVLAWTAVGLGAPTVVAACWLPLHAAVRHVL